MKTNENHSRRVMLLGIFAAAVVVFILNIALGSVSISLSEILGIVTGGADVTETNRAIVQNIRLPRKLATVIGGAALAAAGVLLQVFFNNPIVEPYVLGISSGSTLFVGLVTLGGFSFGMKSIPPMGMVAGAFIGAMAVMLCVIWASGKVKSISTLLIIGLMAGFVCSAVTSMLSALADKEKVTGFYRWSLGSFAGITWEQVAVLYAIGVPFLAAALLMSKSLNSMMLGERYAKSMGVGIRRFRIMIVFISSVLTALVTAFEMCIRDRYRPGRCCNRGCRRPFEGLSENHDDYPQQLLQYGPGNTRSWYPGGGWYRTGPWRVLIPAGYKRKRFYISGGCAARYAYGPTPG